MSKRGDWVPCRNYGDSQVVIGATTENFLLVRHGETILASQSPEETVETTDDIITERVVGQFDIVNSSEETTLIAVRLRVGLYDDTADIAAFYADSLTDGPDANEPFLWQRYFRIQPGFTLIDTLHEPTWSMIDCRVARKLTREQALFFSVFSLNANVGVVLYLRMWARSLG